MAHPDHGLDDGRPVGSAARSTLPAALPAHIDVLAFHDADVAVFIDGVPAASAAGGSRDYVRLPMSPEARAAVRPGPNVIAVHGHHTAGGQYLDVGLTAGR